MKKDSEEENADFKSREGNNDKKELKTEEDSHEEISKMHCRNAELKCRIEKDEQTKKN